MTIECFVFSFLFFFKQIRVVILRNDVMLAFQKLNEEGFRGFCFCFFSFF